MKPMRLLLVFTVTSMLVADCPTGTSQDPIQKQLPEVIEIELTRFQPPSDEDRKQVEQWLLELDLVSMVADHIAFTATGTFFFAGKGKEEHITNLLQYAIGWCLDNRQDRERLLVINQQLLNPDIIDQEKWRLMQSDTSELDQLRIKSLYHEANGSVRYQASPKSRIQNSLESAHTFFPTRAATSNPMTCWSGQAMDRSKPMVTIDKLAGIQTIGKHTVAMFEFHPADFYVFYVSLAFLDGAPVQVDGWRQFRRVADKDNPSPTPAQIEAEREYLLSTAKRVARTQSKWTKLETCAVPVWIQGSTLNDFYDVEVVANIQWYVNEQVNPQAFDPESLQQLGPFSVVRD
jgi:hypothetical protein